MYGKDTRLYSPFVISINRSGASKTIPQTGYPSHYVIMTFIFSGYAFIITSGSTSAPSGNPLTYQVYRASLSSSSMSWSFVSSFTSPVLIQQDSETTEQNIESSSYARYKNHSYTSGSYFYYYFSAYDNSSHTTKYYKFRMNTSGSATVTEINIDINYLKIVNNKVGVYSKPVDDSLGVSKSNEFIIYNLPDLTVSSRLYIADVGNPYAWHGDWVYTSKGIIINPITKEWLYGPYPNAIVGANDNHMLVAAPNQTYSTYESYGMNPVTLTV